ncbi:MAG: S-layer homology domain-containing protein [Bacillota bacterium]
MNTYLLWGKMLENTAVSGRFYHSTVIPDEKRGFAVRRLSTFTFILAFLLVLFLPTLAFTSGVITFKYDDFSDNSLIKTNGDAVIASSPSGDPAIRLTEAQGDQQGSAYYENYVSLVNERSFSTYFTFRMDPKGTTGADGIVFILNNTTNALGESGGGMGYSGIDNSVGVEFDTYDNDPENGDDNLGVNHIAININGDVESPVASATQAENAGYNLKNGMLYHVWIDYDGASDRIEVRMNENSEVRPANPVIAHDGLNLSSILYQDEIYVGFSAATGGAYEEHLIESWYFNNDYTPLDVENEIYDTAPTGVSVTAGEISQTETEMTAEVTDSSGSAVSGIDVSFSSTLGTLSSSVAKTDASGRAVVTLTNDDMRGPYVKAVATGGAYDDMTLPPAAPTLQASTMISITLEEIPGAEYRMDGGIWQADREFSGLAPGTSYDFQARMQATESTPASAPGDTSSLATESDTESPVVSVEAIDSTGGTLVDGGWTKYTPVDVSITATDDYLDVTEYRVNGETWTQYDEPFDIFFEGEHLIEAKATDLYGNVGEDRLGFGIDITEPSIAGSGQPEDGETVDGWTSSELVFDYSATDDLSGVANFDYSLDGGDTWTSADSPFVVSEYCEVTLCAEDLAGNERCETITAQIDTEPPIVEIETKYSDGSPYDGAWTDEDIQVDIAATDEKSGLETVEYSTDGGVTWNLYEDSLLLSDPDVTSIAARATDRVENAATETEDIRIDKEDPVVDMDLALDGATYDGSWTGDPLTFSMTGEDVNLEGLEYRLGGGSWRTYQGEPVQITAEGNYTLTAKAFDTTGREATVSGDVRIDVTGPNIATTITSEDGEQYDGSWTTQDVKFTVTADDVLSGMQELEYSLDDETFVPVTGSFDVTESATVTLRATDVAGNQRSIDTPVRIDRQEPTISFNIFDEEGAAYDGRWAGGDLSVEILGDDADLSGVDEVEYSLDGGTTWHDYHAAVVVSDPGITEIGARITDGAGNVASDTTTVRIDRETPELSVDLRTPDDEEYHEESRTYGPITLRATVDDDVAADIQLSRDDGESWREYSGPVTLRSPGTHRLQIRAIDASGKSSDIENITVKISSRSGTHHFTVDTTIDGESQVGIASGSSEEVDGQQVTCVSIDGERLRERLITEVSGSTVTIAVGGASGIIRAGLDGGPARELQSRGVTLEISSEAASFVFAPGDLDMDSVSEKLGGEISPRDVEVEIELRELPEGRREELRELLDESGYRMTASPIAFELRFRSGDEEISVERFDSHVERRIDIDDPERAEIITGIYLDVSGGYHHVPTTIASADGGRRATLNSVASGLHVLVSQRSEFSDIRDHWAEGIVEEMGSRGVVFGTSEGIFEPDESVTRAEFAAIVGRAFGLIAGDGQEAFTDIPVGSWYAGAVEVARQYGLTEGYGDGTFRPHEIITREEAMVIAARAMELCEIESDEYAIVDEFADADTISPWALSAVEDCLSAEIVLGHGDLVDPGSAISRAETIAIIYRILEVAELI